MVNKFECAWHFYVCLDVDCNKIGECKNDY